MHSAHPPAVVGAADPPGPATAEPSLAAGGAAAQDDAVAPGAGPGPGGRPGGRTGTPRGNRFQVRADDPLSSFMRGDAHVAADPAGCPSGQWERTVNPSALPSKVRILDLPHREESPVTSTNTGHRGLSRFRPLPVGYGVRGLFRDGCGAQPGPSAAPGPATGPAEPCGRGGRRGAPAVGRAQRAARAVAEPGVPVSGKRRESDVVSGWERPFAGKAAPGERKSSESGVLLLVCGYSGVSRSV